MTMNATELAEAISNAVNAGINPDELKDAIQHDHPALQRYMFRQVFKPGIVALAGVEYTDDRNESTVREACRIAETMGWL